jgi:IS30 family transposase
MQRLREGWSPEQIAGRLKRKKSKYALCHETIYQFIYRKKNRKLYMLLPRKKSRRRHQLSRKPRICRFGDKRIISQRSEAIDKRFHYGHWEGDRIEFAGKRSAAITTLVERKTRVVLLINNVTKKSGVVMSDIINKFNCMSRDVSKTFTFDQGSEFSAFNILENNLACNVFYCHKNSPWEKGSNENMNGRVRRYLPFNLSIDQISQEMLDVLSHKLNNTPRKCLDCRTPKELFLRHFRPDCRTWF